MKNSFIITDYKDKKMGFLYEADSDKGVKLLSEAHFFDDKSEIGNISTGRISKRLSKLCAVFVDVGGGREVFVNLSEHPDSAVFLKRQKADKFSEGDILLVQIIKDAIEDKKETGSLLLSLSDRYLVVSNEKGIGISKKIKDTDKRNSLRTLIEELPEYSENNFGVLLRTAATEIDEESLKRLTINYLCKLNAIINGHLHEEYGKCIYKAPDTLSDAIYDLESGTEIITDNPFYYEDLKNISDTVSNERICHEIILKESVTLFSVYRIEHDLEDYFRKKVFLKSGAFLIIESTAAFTVIDVNSGFSQKGVGREEHILSVNFEAAEFIIRLLRIRNISGIILVDFINMKEDDSVNALMRFLRREAFKDRTGTKVVDMTKLGIVEMTRKRAGNEIEL